MTTKKETGVASGKTDAPKTAEKIVSVVGDTVKYTPDPKDDRFPEKRVHLGVIKKISTDGAQADIEVNLKDSTVTVENVNWDSSLNSNTWHI